MDDAPFEKGQNTPVPIIGVVMEGADRVESVAMGRFPVDGEDVTGYLAGWIGGLRTRPALQGVILGGITMAGLAVVDVAGLAERLGLPILIVTRRNPVASELAEALRAAGLEHRLELLARVPRAFGVGEGLHLAHAGASRAEAERLVLSCLAKSRLPEPLRIAHLIGQAMVLGESRGRV